MLSNFIAYPSDTTYGRLSRASCRTVLNNTSWRVPGIQREILLDLEHKEATTYNPRVRVKLMSGRAALLKALYWNWDILMR